MRRPLLGVAAALAMGVVAGFELRLDPLASSVAALLCTATGFVLLRLSQRARLIYLCALAAMVCAGAAYAGSRLASASGPKMAALLSAKPRILRVRGFIVDRPTERILPSRKIGTPDRIFTRFTMRAVAVEHNGAWKRLEGRLRVLAEGHLEGIGYSDGVQALLSARRPSPPGNPGEFDLVTFLERKGINGVAESNVGCLQRTGERRGVPGLAHIFALKNRMLAQLDGVGEDGATRILKCLLLGEASVLTEQQLRAFRETGTLHFLAISGQHVSIIAAICWGVLALIGVSHRLASALVMGATLLYGVLAGLEPSVLRAVIMCQVFCGAFLLMRRPDVLNSMALALIAVLLLEPADVYNPGMQLSFAAVLGMLLFALPLERALFGLPDKLDRLQAPEERPWWKHPVRWLAQKTLCVSLAAWLATLPLLMQHFSMVSPLAPVAAVILLPVVTLTLVTGLPGVLLAPALGALAWPLMAIASVGATFLDRACTLLAQLPGTVLYVPPPGWWLLGFCGAVGTAIVLRDRLNLTRSRIALLLLLPALAYLLFVWHRPTPEHMRINVLSLGRGNSVLTQLPSGKNILFDAGGSGATDIGDRVIAPALRALGLRRLDLVILSHADDDHVNGIAALARQMRVGVIAVSPHFDRHDEASQLLRVLAGHAKVVRVAAGDRIAGLEGAEIAVLWPPREKPSIKLSDNELSTVVMIRGRDGSVLLTGDFGRRATAMLLSHTPELSADVLQTPHHGLHDMSAPALAGAVKPKVAVIPGGRGAIVEPYAAHSGRLLATDDCGMITVDLCEGFPIVATFR